MTTLTWKAFYGSVDTNPMNPKNWDPEGVPNSSTTVVFPGGNITLDPNVHWSAKEIDLTGGARIAFATVPHVSGDVNVENGSAVFVTAPDGTFRAQSINVDNGSQMISARPVKAHQVNVNHGSNFTSQSGIDVHHVEIDGGSEFDAHNGIIAHSVSVGHGSHGKAYGEIHLGSCPYVDNNGSSWNEFPGCNCYASGTMILMHDDTEKAIELIRAGDVIKGGHVVNWLGMSNRDAKFVKISKGTLGATRDLIVTEDHLIVIVDVLYPARMLTYMQGVEYVEHYGEYYHLQTAQHNMVYANGVKSETYFDVDGNNDLTTVSGERLNKRFDRKEAFATIIAPMNHALAA